MKHSIASVSISGTLIEKLQAVAWAGYDGIELFENDLTISNLSPKEVNQICADLKLEIVGLQPFRDFEAMPEPFKSRNLERAKHKFDLMAELGTKKLFVCSNNLIHCINDLNKAAEDLYELAEIASKYNFEIGFEALSWGKYINTYYQSLEVVKRANHSNLGNILDNFHISAVNSTFEEIYRLPKDKITMIQVADAPNYDMGAMHLGRHFRCFPGQGSFPVEEFMTAVLATGYDDYISHEIFSDEFRGSKPKPIALDGKRSLIWLENKIQDSKLKSENTYIPEVKNLVFVELACNKRSLYEILEALNFTETLTHKSKNVRFFEAGNIKFVLNNETQATKNKVLALGLEIDDKQKLEKWTNKLKYNWQASNTEINMPSIKSDGGLLYYFLDSEQIKGDNHKIEFIQKQPLIQTHYLTHFDHIGHRSAPDAFLSNTLFYRALLGFKIQESFEMLDPRGIVYSRVAKNKTGSIQIPLSTLKTQNDTNFEGTRNEIQQIALRSSAIFETARAIKNKDLVLEIPNNYYLDLKAKTQLTQEFIEKMRRFNILYDANENGEFLHFYFKEFDGIFIEIVQRIGKYEKFGEINSQVRLAAQERNREKDIFQPKKLL